MIRLPRYQSLLLVCSYFALKNFDKYIHYSRTISHTIGGTDCKYIQGQNLLETALI